MFFTAATAAFLMTFASQAYAHMEMTSPAPFRSKANPNVQNADFDMVSPLAASGANFPCKGYHSDLGTPQGAPTADFPAGSTQQVTISGGAAHNGGSCQFALSYDQGATFKVIQSNIGNCVLPGGGSSFPVAIPAEAQSGEAIFAWIWHNNTGNREIYMNCAAVTISGSGTSSLNDLPDIFVANLADKGTCAVPEGTDVIFPNPGPNVVTDDTGKLGNPTGDCGAPAAGSPPPPPAADDNEDEETPANPAPAPAPPATSAPAAPPAAPSSGAGAGAGLTYTVVSGDICDTIAAANDVTVAQLLAANPSVNAACSNLAIGQVLNLRRRSRVMRNIA